ncbi:hypothetical protein MAR_038224 [Mya arenaria]|uniref:Uncharacterized protein n=1 Tax=Mya arenaria TaxID=6604 RepID=A0ABY7FRA2_MYAAR|nr:hypothetical protein MAR_038224 [Mya arenaria]
MIGLEALAAFGALMKSPPADMTIWISYMDDRHHKRKFRITPENAMVLQPVDVSLFFNIFMDLEDQDLRLEVDVIKESVNGFTVRSCISWLEEDISGMVVAEIGIPSGFNAFRYGISGHELLMRTEIQEKKVQVQQTDLTI